MHESTVLLSSSTSPRTLPEMTASQNAFRSFWMWYISKCAFIWVHLLSDRLYIRWDQTRTQQKNKLQVFWFFPQERNLCGHLVDLCVITSSFPAGLATLNWQTSCCRAPCLNPVWFLFVPVIHGSPGRPVRAFHVVLAKDWPSYVRWRQDLRAWWVSSSWQHD